MNEDAYNRCKLCPRRCGVNRREGERGVCGAGGQVRLSRAALHFWEEPPLSGESGSGALFFAHCSLGCIYCQNHSLAHGTHGREVSLDRLAAIMGELESQGALNINCVTPTHFAPSIREAVRQARQAGMALPVVWNTGGYETEEAVRENEGTVDIYLSDFKYADAALAKRYSQAPDYPKVALRALEAMVASVGEPRFDVYHGQRRMVGGVVVRHLMLPGALDNSRAVVRLLHEHFGSSICVSLMNQYTPVLAQEAESGNARAGALLESCPELACGVTTADYEALLDYADALGMEDYFWQEGGTAKESFIPTWDYTGI